MEYIDVTVSGRSLREFRAKMLSYPEFQTVIDTELFQGAARSTLAVLKNRRGAMIMHCYIDFFGSNEERTEQRSSFEALFLGMEPVEIDIGDGYFYRAVLTSSAESITKGEIYTTAEYRFRVTRHRDPQVLEVVSYSTEHPENGEIYCLSNAEKTDCVLTISFPGGMAAASFLNVNLNGQTWSYEFSNISIGTIVLDGIHKILLIDGQNATNRITWTDFPYLVPGKNLLEIKISGIAFSRPCTVEYTPTYL